MKRLLMLCLVSGLLFADSGGPDDFGYTWIDSREAGGPAFEWIEIRETGERLPSVSDSDDGEQSLELPRPFIFYDREMTDITISSNGAIAFGRYTYIPYYITSMPSTSDPNNVIAAIWTDLNPSRSPADHGIYYQDFPTHTVIEWYRISEISYTDNEHTFQIVIHYSSKTIFINYLDVTDLTSHTSYTGIENHDGTDGLLCGTWTGDDDFLQDSLTIRFRSTPTAGAPYFNDLSGDDDIQFPEDTPTGWEWGEPASGPGYAHSEENCLGTELSGTYSEDADWSVMTPDLDLGTLAYPVLDFYHWYEAENGIDGGICELSTDDGGTWIYIEPEGGYPESMAASSPLSGFDAYSGSSDDWEYTSFDLSPYSGSQAKFRMRFVADGANQYDGWYIDDIGLHEQYGVIKGRCDLAYIHIDGGIDVDLVELGRSLVTDDEGLFMFDSVKIGTDYTVRFTKEDYLPDSITGVEVTRLDTTYLEKILSPEPYSSDFAENGGGWVAIPSTGGWEWGEPIPVGEPANAHSDSFLWGTNLIGTYPNDTIIRLDLSIDLGYLERPALRFWQWYRMSGEFAGNLFDGGNVKISTDGGEAWEIVMPDPRYGRNYDGIISSHNRFMGGEPAFGGESYGDFWNYVTFDLMDWAFEEVIIRFELSADGMGNNRGWYIDDVSIADNWESVEENMVSLPSEQGMLLYPNPFNSALKITVPDMATVTIHNTTGHIVAELGESRIWHPSDSQSSGIYIVKAVYEGKILTEKVVLMK